MTLAFAVAFWMAGGGCMLGCENMASTDASAVGAPAATETPENTANVVVAADSCASMHGHSCCAKRGSQTSAQGAKNHSSAKPSAKPSDNTAHSSRYSSQYSSTPDAARSTAPSSRHSSRHSSSGASLLQTASGSVVVSALAAPFTSMMDCPLAVNATAALSKARPDDSGGDLLPVSSLDSFTIFKEQLTALTPPSLVPNRGHTYLRCCAFLI